eukprot:6395317-Pyramimonas_sp.AAC.1
MARTTGQSMISASGGAVVGALRALLGRPWGFGGLLGAVLGASCAPVGNILGRLGAVLGRRGAILGHVEALVEPQEAQEVEFVDFPVGFE